MKQDVEQKKTSFFNYKKPWLWLFIVVALAIAAAVTAAILWTLRVWPFEIKTEVAPALDTFIVSTIREQHYHPDHTPSKYPAVAYTVLSVEEHDDTTTVYGVMMYREYTCSTQGELRVWGAANDPFALTAEKTDQGYRLVECWWPQSGKEYIPSIEEKFPIRVSADATNPQQYFAAHDAACKAQAEKNIQDADKYVVLQSEEENLRLAYCPNNAGAYVVFGAGYNTDGTYVRDEDNQTVFTFGERKVAFTIEGYRYIYNAKGSANLPKEWESAGDNNYFTDGVLFKYEDRALVGDYTVSVGLTQTIQGMNWMTDEEITKMFGYVPNNSHITDSADSTEPYYLPIKVLKSRADLDWLLASHMEDSQWPDLKQDNFTQFDEAFFEKNALVMVYYKDGMASVQPKIASYLFTEQGTRLAACLEVQVPAAGDAVVGQWLLFSGVKKADLDGVKALDAYVDNTVTEGEADATLSFTGEVKQVEGRAVLMECTDVPQFSNGVWVELGDAELDPMVGETYTVTYEDLMMPSLPPRITAVTITKM